MRPTPTHPGLSSIDEWQRHTRFLRRLACGLLEDANDVDDVLQETWLVARRSEAPRGRGWLAGVVRNIAAQFTRSEARRSVREESAARTEVMPSIADSAARLNQMRSVVDALEELDEPYRTTLLMRFFDELTPHEIAREIGVPLETVRTRVRRGLERLRGRLTVASGGDARVWGSALIPFSRPPRSRAPFAPRPPVAFVARAALLMTTQAKIAVACAVILSVGWLASRGDATVRDANANLPPRVSEDVLRSPLAVATVIDDPVVQVVESAGTRTEVASPDPPTVEVLDQAAALSGLVRTRDGKPIAGARLHLFTKEVFTDSDGRFGLAWRDGSQLPVFVEADGFAQRRVEIDALDKSEQRSIEIVLHEDLRIVGVIRDRFGRPVAGASIMSVHTPENFAMSASDGRYEFAHLDPERTTQAVLVRKEGFVQSDVEFRTDRARTMEIDFVLDEGVRVAGRVLDANGRAIAGASVRIGRSPGDLGRAEASTRADGSFVVQHVRRGSGTLIAEAEGFAPQRTPVEYSGDLDEWTGVEIELAAAHFLEGYVLSSELGPMSDVRVHPRLHGESLDGYATTDTDGFFRLDSLPTADGLSLMVIPPQSRSARHGSARVQVAAVDIDDLEITLGLAGLLAGRVIDDETGAPIVSFKVRLIEPIVEEGDVPLVDYRSVWSETGVFFHSDDGRWIGGGDTSFLDGGVTGLEVSAEGYAVAMVARAVAAANPNPDALLVRLTRGTSVSGTVVDATTGVPIEGATVDLERVGESPLTVLSTAGRVTRRPTDAFGRFRFDAIERGSIRLHVRSDRHREVRGDAFDLSGPAERTIELDRID